MVMQNLARLLERRADRHSDQIVFRHPLGDRQIEARLESQIAVGENADQLSVRVRHRHAGNLVLLHHLQRLGDRLPRPHGDRVDDHARFRALHFVDLFRLLLDRHVLVDDTESALLRHGDRQARLGHRVHRRGDDRDVESNVAGQTRGDVDEVRVKVGLRRAQQDVVKCQTDRNRFDRPFRRNCLRLLDLVEIDAPDDRNLAEYTFVAHGQAL